MKKGLISTILIIFVALSVALAVSSCNGAEKPTAIPREITHGGSVKESETLFATKGNSDYRIVLPDGADENEQKASSELVSLIYEATGAPLSVVKESEVSFDKNEKLISLGAKKLEKSAGFSVDGTLLGEQGFELHTFGQSLFVIANGSQGTLYGAYELLNCLVGFEQYNDTFYSLNKADEIRLPVLKIREVPDISYRVASYGSSYLRANIRDRMRTHHNAKLFVENTDAHDMLRTIIPHDPTEGQIDYYLSHSKWFMEGARQLCYTAHGDEGEYDLLVKEIANRCKQYILADEEHSVVSLTQMDEDTWCACEACSALKERYGTDAASQILLVNSVVDELEPWLKEIKRDIRFVIFAYHKTEKPPVVECEGEWTVADESVVLNERTSVWIAPIYAQYTDEITPSSELYTLTQKWSCVAKSIYFWGYDCYFKSYLTPYNSYDFMESWAKRMKEINAQFAWMQGSYNTGASTGFDDLKNYLYAKLCWNTSLDTEALTEGYFSAVYKECAEEMKSAFLLMREQMQKQKTKGLDKGIWQVPLTSEWWEQGAMEQMLGLFSSAKQKTSDTAILYLIKKEEIFPRFVLNEVYGRADETLLSDANALGISMFSETQTLTEYFNQRG